MARKNFLKSLQLIGIAKRKVKVIFYNFLSGPVMKIQITHFEDLWHAENSIEISWYSNKRQLSKDVDLLQKTFNRL